VLKKDESHEEVMEAGVKWGKLIKDVELMPVQPSVETEEVKEHKGRPYVLIVQTAEDSWSNQE
jgi:hypothetical protein